MPYDKRIFSLDTQIKSLENPRKSNGRDGVISKDFIFLYTVEERMKKQRDVEKRLLK